jgi:Fur family ferric uptake transcriptional regulator
MAPQHVRDRHQHTDVDERVETILDALRGRGGRITIGRRAIVRALYTADDHHVTADDVAAIVQAHHPDVHLSTVYRTLEALVELGVVDRIALGEQSRVVYHLADHAHHHLVCERCGTVVEVPEQVAAGLARRISKRYGFTVARSRLAIRGRCHDCSTANAT